MADGVPTARSVGAQGEEAAFVEGVRRHGREAKLIAKDLGTGRSIGDVKKYYQKHKKCARPRARSALHLKIPFAIS